MRITFTDSAITAIRERFAVDAKLKLVYDTEGCGCAVSGVPALRVIGRAEQDDEQAASNAFAVYFAKRQAVFFEEELAVDFLPDARAFRLKSKQQIYSGSMAVMDERSQSALEAKA
jgi:uncharacterized protein YqkB